MTSKSTTIQATLAAQLNSTTQDTSLFTTSDIKPSIIIEPSYQYGKEKID